MKVYSKSSFPIVKKCLISHQPMVKKGTKQKWKMCKAIENICYFESTSMKVFQLFHDYHCAGVVGKNLVGLSWELNLVEKWQLRNESLLFMAQAGLGCINYQVRRAFITNHDISFHPFEITSIQGVVCASRFFLIFMFCIHGARDCTLKILNYLAFSTHFSVFNSSYYYSTVSTRYLSFFNKIYRTRKIILF